MSDSDSESLRSHGALMTNNSEDVVDQRGRYRDNMKNRSLSFAEQDIYVDA